MDRAGAVPNFMFMSLGENHTQGTTPGAYTPKAQVASNDLAVGKIVEAITQFSRGEDVKPEILIPTRLYRKADAEKDASLR